MWLEPAARADVGWSGGRFALEPLPGRDPPGSRAAPRCGAPPPARCRCGSPTSHSVEAWVPAHPTEGTGSGRTASKEVAESGWAQSECSGPHSGVLRTAADRPGATFSRCGRHRGRSHPVGSCCPLPATGTVPPCPRAFPGPQKKLQVLGAPAAGGGGRRTPGILSLGWADSQLPVCSLVAGTTVSLSDPLPWSLDLRLCLRFCSRRIPREPVQAIGRTAQKEMDDGSRCWRGGTSHRCQGEK